MKSWEATRWAKKTHAGANGEPLTRSEKHLLQILADYHNEAAGYAWAAMPTLAADTHFSTRQVRRLIARLEKKGVFWTEKRNGKIHRYYLNVDALGRPTKPVDKPVTPVDKQGQNVPGRDGVPGTFQAPTGDIIVSSDRGHNSVPQDEYNQEEEMKRGPQQKILSQIIRPGRWDRKDIWLKRFLDGPACFFIPMGALDDPGWWDSLSASCDGIDIKFIGDSFAKMKCYVFEQDADGWPSGKRPETPGEWKNFVRQWLCRENDWSKRTDLRGQS